MYPPSPPGPLAEIYGNGEDEEEFRWINPSNPPAQSYQKQPITQAPDKTAQNCIRNTTSKAPMGPQALILVVHMGAINGTVMA